MRIGFFTLRDVQPFEELTFDYKFQRYGFVFDTVNMFGQKFSLFVLVKKLKNVTAVRRRVEVRSIAAKLKRNTSSKKKNERRRKNRKMFLRMRW